MSNFALLWSKILDSSIWIKGSKETRLLWITMLAMKNYEGKILASTIGLADRAKISVEDCRAGLEVLLSPDPDDTSGVEGGRRVRVIQGGWEIVNHDLYRFSTEAKREFWREQKKEQRQKQKRAKRKKSAYQVSDYESGARRYQAALDRGDQAEADRIAAEPAERLELDRTPPTETGEIRVPDE